MVRSSSLPPRYQKWLQDIREVEAADSIAGLVGDCRTVLNVGPSWGRDYYVLSSRGKTVTNLDIAPQHHLPSMILGDITREIPAADRSFEVVILAEVLEHLIDDAAALLSARRVLADDGRLVVTVPFYDDGAEFHVRIHSPASIRRLLSSCGFEIVEYYERGGLVAFARAIHASRKLASFVLAAERYNRLIIRADRWLARHARWLLRRSPGYGCYLWARKSSAIDYRSLNALEFGH
jgi:SAM-dependent methyltransferase